MTPVSNAPFRRWFQFSLGTWLVTIAFVAWFMKDRVLCLTVSIPLAKVRVPAWKTKLFHFQYYYVGPNAMQKVGMDFEDAGNFDHSWCLALLATAPWRGKVHVAYAVIGLDRLFWPMSFLAAYLTWKIGQRIASRRRARVAAAQPASELGA